MKKLSAILQKKTSKSLAEAREKRILSVLGLAKANAEEDKAAAADRTERLLLSLGDDDVDSERSKEIIEKIVDSKIEEDDCQLILDKLNEVIEELNAEYKED